MTIEELIIFLEEEVKANYKRARACQHKSNYHYFIGKMTMCEQLLQFLR